MTRNFELIVMGVSGCGKSTIAEALAQQLNYPYLEGDSFHPPENIKKMQQGHPLNDDDRQGWLETLNRLLREEPKGAVLSCSALKPSYRDILKKGISNPIFVYLQGDFDTIWSRLESREDHFFHGKDMLRSQFDTLVAPTGSEAITIDVRLPVEVIVKQVIDNLQARQ